MSYDQYRREILRQADELGNVIRAFELLEERLCETSLGDRFLLLELGRSLCTRATAQHLSAPVLARLEGMEDPLGGDMRTALRRAGEEAAAPACGEVQVLLYHPACNEGLVATLSVRQWTAQEAPLPEDLADSFPRGSGPAFRRALAAAEPAVLSYLAAHHRFQPRAADILRRKYRLGGFDGAPGLPVDGDSIGLAAALAAFSLISGIPVSREIAVTGAIRRDGQVLPVGSVPQKIRAALRERPSLSRILVPYMGEALADPRVAGVPDLATALEEVYGRSALDAVPCAAVDGPATIEQGIRIFRFPNRFPEAATLLEIGLEGVASEREQRRDPRLYRKEEFLGRWRFASSLVHLGDIQQASRGFEETAALAERLWDEQVIDPGDYIGFYNSYAGYLRDVFRFEEARDLLLRLREEHRLFRVERHSLARLMGNLGEVRMFLGEYEEALVSLGESRAILEEVYPQEIPRTLCYLGNVELQRQRPAAALDRYDEGLALNQQVPIEQGSELNEGYLRFGRQRALHFLERYEESVAEGDRALSVLSGRGPEPANRVQRFRGLSRLALGQEALGREDLRQAGSIASLEGTRYESSVFLHYALGIAWVDLGERLLASGSDEEQREGRELLSEFLRRVSAVPGLEPKLPDGARALVRAFPYGP